MASGPSKQELEMYWQNSRQYFDELAKHYQQADPKYYKEYILPFYQNPFRSKGGSQSQNFSEGIYNIDQPSGRKKGGAAGFALFGAVFAVVGIGAAVYFLIGSTTERSYQKDPVVVEKPVVADTISTVKPPEVKDAVDPDFAIAKKLYLNKRYEQAENRLKRIKPDSPNYEEAQELLEEIQDGKLNEQLHDAKEKQQKNSDGLNKPNTGNDRNRRTPPVQPVR